MAAKEALPFVAMVCLQVLQAGSFIASKQAILTGMSNFTYIFYSNAMSSLIVLPTFLIHRQRPPLNFSIVSQIFVFGFIGCFTQLIGYEGLKYAPPSLASAMFNIIPGLTFIFAIILRMEIIEWRSSSTIAKSVGVAVSISGAVIATLYQGPKLLTFHSNSLHQQLFVPETNIALGGSFIALQCTAAAIFVITEALIAKKYPVASIILFFYFFSETIISLVLAFIIEGNQISWTLLPTSRLIAVVYSGVIESPLQIGVQLWCVKRKGPLFVAMFQPLGIVIAAIMDIILLGDPFYLGILLGSVVIVSGLYCFLWGKAQEEKTMDDDEPSNQESVIEERPLLLP